MLSDLFYELIVMRMVVWLELRHVRRPERQRAFLAFLEQIALDAGVPHKKG